jgi:hypothetical protein
VVLALGPFGGYFVGGGFYSGAVVSADVLDGCGGGCCFCGGCGGF